MDFAGGHAQNGLPASGCAARVLEKIMGLAMSVPQLLIILVIVALIFGTKRLKDLGGDLGGALRSFRKAVNPADDAVAPAAEAPQLARDEERK